MNLLRRSYGIVFSGCVAGILVAGCQARTTTQSAVKTTYFQKYGVEVDGEQDWIARGATGEVIKTLKNGVVVKEKYCDGMLQGNVTATFPYSEIVKRLTHYEKGILQFEVDHFISGAPQEKKQFLGDEKVLLTAWYEDGTPRAKEEYHGPLIVQGEYFTHDAHPEAHVVEGVGIRTVRDGLGNLVQKETISQGEVILSESYHPNGSPRERVAYTKGKIDGTRKVFLVGGEPERFEEWKQGVLEGKTVLFQNGEKYAEIPYEKGEKHGVELRFKPGTDVVVEEIAWERNQRHGASVAIIDDQRITEWYYEGKKTSKSQYLEMSGHTFSNRH